MADVHVHQSFAYEAPNWLEGRVLTAVLKGLPQSVPLRKLPVRLGGTDRQIGWGFPQYYHCGKSDGIEVRVEIDDTIAGQYLIDALRYWGPGPGTVMPVLTPDNELTALVVTPGGTRRGH